MISFIRSHKLLVGGASVLFAAVVGLSILAVREMQLPGSHPADSDQILGSQTESDVQTEDTTAAPETTEPVTEAVTEPPVPFFPAVGDMDFYPDTHDADAFPTAWTIGAMHRVYAACPDTDSAAFNDYCERTVSSLAASVESAETAREGGSCAVTIDYKLYMTETVYSAVFTCCTHDTLNGSAAEEVIVLIFNTETESVYAPLDSYDMTVASQPLADLIRAGYKASFADHGLEADEAYLDTVCTPDPSSFVNIALDDKHMYFFTVYDGEGQPTLLCAAVLFDDMKKYTWEAIEADKLASQLPPPDEDIIHIDIPTYDLSGAVPESAAVADSYFDDALFIGNSLIVGLQRAVPLNARYFASVGLNVSQVFSKELIPLTDGTTVTIADAIGRVEFSKVYLMFGINELGWGSITSFINYYAKIIDCIRESNPQAVIYVQSILPINEEKWAKSRDYQSCINNYAVATFNQKIVEMCNNKNVCFVNVAEVLTDETGNLFSESTSDGVHVGGVFSVRWVEYLKTHTVQLDS